MTSKFPVKTPSLGLMYLMLLATQGSHAQTCREHESIAAPDGQGVSGEGPGDWLGASLAASGDLLVSGAPIDVVQGIRRGSVRVFRRLGDSTFVHETTLWSESASGKGWAMTGFSVDIFADLLVIGAPGADVGLNNRQGAALVFRRIPEGGWSQLATLVAPDGMENDGFGASVAVSGDTIVVGVPSDSVSGPGGYLGNYNIPIRRGSAYVYRLLPSGSWTFIAKLEPNSSVAFQGFGAAVAVSGDWLAVGAPTRAETAQSQTGEGHVYMFRREGGAWIQRSDLTAPVQVAYRDLFGYGLHLEDDRLIVGSGGTNNDFGAGHIFERVGSVGWVHRATLNPLFVNPPGQASPLCGLQARLSGDLAVLGTVNGATDAVVFRRQATGAWTQSAILRRPGPGWGAWSNGHPVAFLSDRIAIGNRNMLGQAGAVTLYPSDFSSPDSDGDGVANLCDNCPNLANPSQVDCDHDGIGDACEILMPLGDCNEDSIPDDCQSGLSDCDADGVRDICEIASGAESDLNSDGVPDRCQCIADVNGSGAVDAVDLAVILTRWGGDPDRYPNADIDRDGIIGSSDLSIVLAGWGNCP